MAGRVSFDHPSMRASGSDAFSWGKCGNLGVKLQERASNCCSELSKLEVVGIN